MKLRTILSVVNGRSKIVVAVFSLLALLIELTIMTCAAMAAPVTAPAVAQKAVPNVTQRPLILVHYMPWFDAKPFSPHWGWHWTMNAFDPEKQQAGKHNIASHYYPLIGPYDSGDPAVIEYHLLLMKLAGIDGLVVDWYGRTDHFDYAQLHRNTAALFAPAKRIGLRLVVCYEDQTIPQLVDAKKVAAENRVQHAQQEIDWLEKNWWTEPAYLKLDGKPVLLSFGHNGLNEEEWNQVLAPKRDRLVYLSEHRRRDIAAGAFDWPVPQEGLGSLDRFYQQSKNWPVAMPVAFPRFHDIYAEAKVHASWGKIDDNEGQVFVKTLQRALQSGARFMQIATWNDWGEGTIIEPSQEFGYRDLEAVQRLRRETIEPQFSFKAPDLRLAHRLFLLRRKETQSPQSKGELDRISGLIASGSLPDALASLQKIEVSTSQQQAPPETTNVNATKTPTTGAATPAKATHGVPVTISVASGARQRFAGFGASMGNWDGAYQSLPKAQRLHLAKMFWRDLNFKILRLWFNVDNYSPTRGAHDLSLFRKQYVRSGIIADAKANGVTTLLFAPDHIPPYMRSTDKVDGPINDPEVENFVTLIAEAIRQLRDEDGIRIHATGIENEPDMTPAQVVRAVKHLRSELDARGLKAVKIIASEAASSDDRFYSHLDALRADSGAWNSLAGIASHSYNMAATDKAASYIAGADGRNTKEYWMTEASDNGPEEEGITGIPAIRAASLASRFLNDMNHRVTHWVHFLGLEDTKAPNTDDATRIIAYQTTPFRFKVLKKYYTYQQLARAFDVGALFRDSQSSLDGDMTWTYGQKPHLFAATARNPNGTWSIGVCNFSTDSFLNVQGWADDKWNIEQGGHTPGQTFPVTIRVDEMKHNKSVAFVVHRTNDTLKNSRAETVMMKNGEVTFNVAPLELVTLRSTAKR